MNADERGLLFNHQAERPACIRHGCSRVFGFAFNRKPDRAARRRGDFRTGDTLTHAFGVAVKRNLAFDVLRSSHRRFSAFIGGSFSHKRLLCVLSVSAAVLAGGGCAPRQRVTVPERVAVEEPPHVEAGERIAADPLGFVREVEQRASALESYRLMFYRQERLGLFPRLGATEEIRAKFRREPFSVKFDWVDPGDFYEAVYVEGRHDDKLLVRERRGFLAFPPQVRAVNVEDPVAWGRSLNPVTDFGLARVTQRTLAPFDDPQTAGLMTIRYEGLVSLEPMDRPAHHLRVEGPARTDTPFTAQDFYVDADTLLPAGTDLWLARGQLGARYRYADVETDVQLTDEDFGLSRGQPAL